MSRKMPSSSSGPSQTSPGIAFLFLWGGLVTGLGESLLLLFKRYVRHRFIMTGDDIFWMAPLSETLLFTVLGLVVLGCTRWTPARNRERVVATLLVSMGTLCLLVLWGRLDWYADVLLALGVGLQGGRWLTLRLGTVSLLARRTLPVLLATVLFVVLGTFGLRWRRDRINDSLPGRSGPNVLLIILDTVRSYNLSLYGYSRSTTPGLERWGTQGTVFEHAFSPSSWTLPSHATMFTGRWPTELSVSFRIPLDTSYPTLAEALSSDGYATGGFAANLIYTTRETGLARGFNHYEDYGVTWGEFARSPVLLRKLLDQSRWKWWTQRWGPASWRSADDVSHEALHWIERRDGRPWFAFLNYIEAHDPWFVPAPFDTLFGAGARALTWKDVTTLPLPSDSALHKFEVAYDGALAYLDSRVSGLLDTLDQQKILANTIVIITADHGEEIGEHGAFGHGQSLYRPVVQVPLLVIAPGCAGGYRPMEPVSLRDLPATIAQLVQLKSSPFPGESFTGQICRHSKPENHEPIFSILKEARGDEPGPMVSVVADSLRYIDTRKGRGELYDFMRDPWEKKNLIDTPAGFAVLGRYRALTDSIVSSPASRRAVAVGAHDVQPRPAIDEQTEHE
jgi:arylsulfatase A-like enzyme